MSDRHAAIEVTNARARLAIGAVGIKGAFTFFRELSPVSGWGGSSLLAMNLSASLDSGLWVIAAVLYCRWLYRAYEDNQRLEGPRLESTPGNAIASFFIPFLNLYRPYQVLRDLYESSDPRPLPSPAQFRAATSVVDYRSSALEEIAPPRWNKWCSVGWWWATYGIWPLFGGAVARMIRFLGRLVPPVMLADAAVGVASTVLAIQVILAIQARQSERLRRLEIAPASTVDAVGSRVGRISPGNLWTEDQVAREEDQPALPKQSR